MLTGCSVREFEYTRECIVFDLLGIHLYHGWLADPQHATEMSAVGQCTYNQLVEKIIEEKNSQSEQKLTEGIMASTRGFIIISWVFVTRLRFYHGVHR